MTIKNGKALVIYKTFNVTEVAVVTSISITFFFLEGINVC